MLSTLKIPPLRADTVANPKCHICGKPMETVPGTEKVRCNNHTVPTHEHQTPEYVPVGPVRMPRKKQQRSTPEQARVKGWLYDADSGICVGLASDEMKKEHKAREPWVRMVGGLRQRVLIW